MRGQEKSKTEEEEVSSEHLSLERLDGAGTKRKRSEVDPNEGSGSGTQEEVRKLDDGEKLCCGLRCWRVKDSTEPSMRPNAYLPKRRGILAIRHFPPNCGRRGEAEGGIDGGGGFSRRAAVDEAMFEEEEEEPEESVVDGFEEEEEGGDDGGRSWGGNEKTVRSDGEVRRSCNFGVQWH
ncbi:unnamed protein product [Linum trigynum]|uniref:Uncharacterized protein n=1 Tax=Linum trigynum TaxID=586398 RepID=A0AAV2E6W5_9ROSI